MWEFSLCVSLFVFLDVKNGWGNADFDTACGNAVDTVDSFGLCSAGFLP